MVILLSHLDHLAKVLYRSHRRSTPTFAPTQWRNCGRSTDHPRRSTLDSCVSFSRVPQWTVRPPVWMEVEEPFDPWVTAKEKGSHGSHLPNLVKVSWDEVGSLGSQTTSLSPSAPCPSHSVHHVGASGKIHSSHSLLGGCLSSPSWKNHWGIFAVPCNYCIRLRWFKNTFNVSWIFLSSSSTCSSATLTQYPRLILREGFRHPPLKEMWPICLPQLKNLKRRTIWSSFCCKIFSEDPMVTSFSQRKEIKTFVSFL